MEQANVIIGDPVEYCPSEKAGRWFRGTVACSPWQLGGKSKWVVRLKDIDDGYAAALASCRVPMETKIIQGLQEFSETLRRLKRGDQA